MHGRHNKPCILCTPGGCRRIGGAGVLSIKFFIAFSMCAGLLQGAGGGGAYDKTVIPLMVRAKYLSNVNVMVPISSIEF